MTNEQIISGNRVVAKFIGYKILPSGYGHKGKRTLNFIETGYSNNPFYHNDFDWLMVVWNKIAELRDKNNTDETKIYLDGMEISSHSCRIKAYPYPVHEGSNSFIAFEVIEDYGEGNEELTNKTLQDCVFKCCVQFIEWYNKQK